jgi:hypothetical protein
MAESCALVCGKCVDEGEGKDSWGEGEPEMLLGSGIGRGTARSDDNIYEVVMT